MKNKLIYIESLDNENFATLLLQNYNEISDNLIVNILQRVMLIDKFRKFKYRIINSRNEMYDIPKASEALQTFIYYDTKFLLWKVRYYNLPDLNILNLLENKKIIIYRFEATGIQNNLKDNEQYYFNEILHISDIETVPIYSKNVLDHDDSLNDIIRDDDNITNILIITINEFHKCMYKLFKFYERHTSNFQIYIYNKQDNSYSLLSGNPDKIIIQRMK